MPDTNTAVLGLLLMATGGDTNVWGSNLNTQVIQLIENKLCGHTAVVTTGGTTTLSQSQCCNRHIDVTGALASDATLVVPNATNGWIVNNNTTGGFGLIVKTSGGSASCSVPQGTSKEVNCDGSNNVQRVDRNIAGELFFHAGSTAPAGAQEADGSAIKRTRAPEAYAALGTTWGPGNGVDDFVLPDAKTAGKFLRSRTGSVTVGTVQADTLASHTHTGTTDGTAPSGTTDSQGAHQHNAYIDDPKHTHTVPIHTSGVGLTNGADQIPQIAGSTTTTSSVATGVRVKSSSGGSADDLTASAGAHTHAVTVNSHTHTFTTGATGGSETRPTNLVGILCVRL